MVEQLADVLGDAEDPQPLGRVDDGRLGLAHLLVGQPLFLGGVEANLFDRGIELGLESLAGVPGHEGGMLADDLLAAQAGGLFLLVAGDVELGVRLQERTAIRAQWLVGEFLLDRAGSVPLPGDSLVDLDGSWACVSECSSSSATAVRRWLMPFCSSGIKRATLAAISDFQLASNRAVDSSRCLARRLRRAVPISGLSSVTSRSPFLTFCPSTTWTSLTMPAARGRISTCRSELTWIMPATPTSVARRSNRAGSVAIFASAYLESVNFTVVVLAAGRC